MFSIVTRCTVMQKNAYKLFLKCNPKPLTKLFIAFSTKILVYCFGIGPVKKALFESFVLCFHMINQFMFKGGLNVLFKYFGQLGVTVIKVFEKLCLNRKPKVHRREEFLWGERHRKLHKISLKISQSMRSMVLILIYTSWSSELLFFYFQTLTVFMTCYALC